MRVLVDASTARSGGGLVYAISQLSALIREDDSLTVTVIIGGENIQAFRAVPSVRLVRISSATLTMRVLMRELAVVRLMGKHDVLYCPGNYLPVAALLGLCRPSIVAVQNANMFGRGVVLSHNKSWGRRLRRLVATRSVQVADQVVAISEYIADEVLSSASVRGLTVIPSGAPEWPGDPVCPDWRVGRNEYFLSMANDYPHKRLGDIVRGWSDAFFRGRPRVMPELVMAGAISTVRRHELLQLAAPELREKVLFTGSVQDRRVVRWLYENALASVSASELEAFPLGPSEAGSVGCPSVLSDIPPHREVDRGAMTEYFPVGDVGTLASSLCKIAERGKNDDRWVWPTSWSDNARNLISVLGKVSVGQGWRAWW